MKNLPVAERFMRYARILTPSREGSDTFPSTHCQFDLANVLVDEMKMMGINDARVDAHCYVFGYIPATEGCEAAPALGFIAHMDTVSDFADHAPCPMVIEDYDGNDIELGGSGRAIKVSDFPHLPSLKGRTLITTDGTTVLGADDKAGVAEIMAMADELIHSGIPHGKICIGFTPDEEIGAGPDHFDVEGFGADYAYTVDGGPEGSIEYENFNAAGAMFEVHGFNVHPGDAKDIMINAALVAMEINGLLPAGETPRDTEGYEGFYHLIRMEGAVDTARLIYIVRDHDADIFEERIKTLRSIERQINEKYGEGTVKLQMKEQYRNMAEQIRNCFHLVENAKAAIEEAGLTPSVEPIRGGTDGAQLSFMGLPCPNLGTGGYAAHGPYEHISVEGMEKCVEILINIIQKYA
ncbi:MAG: peptidase T [Clostridiales bacterium]|nr:peptidase T [Clostridiales bacterium]